MATPYKYIWNWRWKVRYLGTPTVHPNIYIEDSVRDVVYDKLLNQANEHNIDLFVESVNTHT